MKNNYPILASTLLLSSCSLVECSAQEKAPNIILILADDMGYSDIGCYGGEIATPNINELAASGVRFSQFYNASRSCPTRASLMTGLYQHQTGIGWMSEDPFIEEGVSKFDFGEYGYRGFINNNCVTIAEVLKGAGYNTYITGKWHLGMHGEEKWPLQRGFDRFYGILAGACSYMCPDGGRGITLDNTKQDAPTDPDYYTTDKFTDYALDFIKSSEDDPYFLYLAYNAPHWPLQAKEEDIAKFEKLYLEKGWDAIRSDRYERMVELGIIPEATQFAEWENRDWSELSDKEKKMTAYRMAVYAAQVHTMDRNIGRVLDYVEQSGESDNTLILFLSDNGACAEPMNRELGGGKQSDINNPAISGHPSYGRAWAQTSNTPFRKYKQRAYEGGISTPLIVRWGNKLDNKSNTWCTTPGFLPDLMATIVDVSGAKYPTEYKGEKIHPMEGKSLISAMSGECKQLHDYIYWEHQGNRAVRKGDWKAVWDEKINTWELYNIANDRAERHNLAAENPKLVKELSQKWEQWADSHYVEKNFVNKSAQPKK